jgi:hypothetical protein
VSLCIHVHISRNMLKSGYVYMSLLQQPRNVLHSNHQLKLASRAGNKGMKSRAQSPVMVMLTLHHPVIRPTHMFAQDVRITNGCTTNWIQLYQVVQVGLQYTLTIESFRGTTWTWTWTCMTRSQQVTILSKIYITYSAIHVCPCSGLL